MAEHLALADTAVAVIDALGFKGIWKRHDPVDVLKALEAWRQTADDVAQWGNELIHQDVNVAVSLFSDTIVATAARAQNSGATNMNLVATLARTVLKLTTMAFTIKPPMAYRGAFSFGPLAIGDGFFVGPAIDEAAQWAESADAALVWLCPSARDVLGTPQPGTAQDLHFVPWSVPLKRVGTLDTYALNAMVDGKYPGCVHAAAWDDVSILRSGALARFRETSDVQVDIKRQNTQRFLDAAEAHSRRWYAGYGIKG